MVKIIISFIFLFCIKLTYGQESDSLNKHDANGLRTGKWVIRWEGTGKMGRIENYVAGKRYGLCSYYNQDGELENEVEYYNDSINGIFKFYSITGQVEISEYVRGKQEGMCRLYNYKGVLTEDYEYHNNMTNGAHRIFSQSGRIIMETTYVNGFEHGTRYSYKDNDKRENYIQTDWVKGRRIETRYYKKGKLEKTVIDDPNVPQEIPK
jgi:antitoxin component YwqK of YwqJK toxin-antitoxin module